jgi:hypothetical protein
MALYGIFLSKKTLTMLHLEDFTETSQDRLLSCLVNHSVLIEPFIILAQL